MLKVLCYMEGKLTSDDSKFVQESITRAGGEVLALFIEQPPSLRELIEHNPDVVISSATARLSPGWAFLLMLRRLRFEGKEWPKVILATYPASGRYFSEAGHYDEEAADYVYQYRPYSELYDIALEGLFEDIRPCLAVLEVDHLAYTTGARKQWLLTDSQEEYGLLTFSHLEFLPARSPALVCTFQNTPSFTDDLRLLFERARLLQECECQVHPLGERMRIDDILLLSDPDERDLVKFSIQGTEARVYLRGLMP